MTAFTTLYDVTKNAGGGPMFVVGIFVSAIFGALALLSWRSLRGKGEQNATFAKRLAPLQIALGLMVSVGMASYLLWRAGLLGVRALDYDLRRYEILDGCVSDFSERQWDRLTIDSFSLGGRRFEFSDSGWTLGYDIPHSQGSPISENAHLRIFASGRAMLRIDFFPGPCRGPVK
jgi:hypothetical protein